MILSVPDLLSPNELARCRSIIEKADWQSGVLTAGLQSAKVKNNQQLPETAAGAMAARAIIVAALAKNALFFSAVLPKKTFPPLFNRYEGDTNSFGSHIDNAVRTSATGLWVRTDLSATLFLSEPAEYDGGELVVEDTFGVHRIKLNAGDMILYPSRSLHRVEAVTRGCRLAAFFWIESMVRNDEQRRLLFEMDSALVALRERDGDTDEVISLTGCYHNLLRFWLDT